MMSFHCPSYPVDHCSSEVNLTHLNRTSFHDVLSLQLFPYLEGIKTAISNFCHFYTEVNKCIYNGHLVAV